MGKLTKAALSRKKAVSDEVLIPADDLQAQKLATARETLENARRAEQLAQISGDASATTAASLQVGRAEVALEEVKDEIRKKGTAFTLVGVGRLRWDELLREHPPTDEQKAEDEERTKKDPTYQARTFDPAAFWPAVLAESVPDSDLTAEDWRKLVFESKEWGPAELDQLRTRASAVNQGSRILQLGN